MDDVKSQLIDKLKNANNVLVTVSRNPSVDQLASLLGLTLLLNKQGKHAAAVFSGEVPSTIEFLQPEETIEKNTDSLRDFIIALDKAKADKLRYKVEDNVVRIFITPYKTSITQEDLDFSQGDFNVDVVVALGVQQQEDLDEAITAHGRILHDATITSINTVPTEGLGSVTWNDPQASSLCELVTELIEGLDGKLMDNQIATALLTGIVAQTDRFSNAKTTSQTMSMSAVLMSAGANQQLIASKLDENHDEPKAADSDKTDKPTDSQKSDETNPDSDGAIDIDHEDREDKDLADDSVAEESPKPDKSHESKKKKATPKDSDSKKNKPEPTEELIDNDGKGFSGPDEPTSTITGTSNKRITEPPQLGGMLTANSEAEQLSPAIDPMSLTTGQQPKLLDHDSGSASVAPGLPLAQPTQTAPVTDTSTDKPDEPAVVASDLTPPPANWGLPPPPVDTPIDTTAPSTLTDLEEAVDSPHADQVDVNDARSEVNRAITGSDQASDVASEPLEALNAQQFGGDLHQSTTQPANPVSPGPHLEDILGQDSGTSVLPPAVPVGSSVDPAALPALPTDDTTTASPQVIDPTAPPPVPPPIPFQFGTDSQPPKPKAT